jgi:hypothetical protein
VELGGVLLDHDTQQAVDSSHVRLPYVSDLVLGEDSEEVNVRGCAGRLVTRQVNK